MYRDTWMEVDLDAIADNVRSIHQICGKRIIAVIKADAYGCGDIQVAKACLDAGAEMLAVSSLDEAMMLRNEGYGGEVLILGAGNPEDALVLSENGISTAAFSLDWVKEVVKHDCSGMKVHLAVDTGMNRIGFREIREMEEARDILLHAGVKLTGIFTHFCCTDTSREMTDRQYLKFAEAVKALDYPFEWIHCDNSDATIFFRDSLSNACRVGISLYGISGFKKDLKPALGLYTKLVMSKLVPAGETIGYGATYETKTTERIGTIPIGYADGFIRANQGRKVYIDGCYAEVVGRVCMDQTMIRLPEEKQIGSVVEIFGSHIPLEQMAAELHTIPYEIISLISGRVTRLYRKNGKISSESNERILKSEI